MTATHNPHSGKLVRRHFPLLLRIVATELRARYAGSLFGASWAVLGPLLALAVYALVFSVVLKVSPPMLTRSEYVYYLLAGMVPFLMTSEAVTHGVGSILASRAVWTNTVFPVDLAPVKSVLLSQPAMMVGLVLLLGARLAGGGFTAPLVLLPFIWALHVMALTGVTWVLSLINVVIRDLQNALGLLLMLLSIATPIAYTPEMVPERLRFLVALNPFAYFVRAYQEVLVFGAWPQTSTLIVLVTLAVSSYALGGFFFARMKPLALDHV